MMERKRFESKKIWQGQEQEIREQMEKGRGGNKVICGRERQRRAVKVGSSGVFGRLHLSKVWVGASADERTTMTLWALSELDPCDQAQLSTMLIPFYLSAFHPAHISCCTFSRPCFYALLCPFLPSLFHPFSSLFSPPFPFVCYSVPHCCSSLPYMRLFYWTQLSAHNISARKTSTGGCFYVWSIFFLSS